MPTVSIRELARNTSGVVSAVARTGRPALVTRHGAPVVALIPLDEEQLEDFVLSTSPEIAEDLAAAERDLAAGNTQPADEFFAELATER